MPETIRLRVSRLTAWWPDGPHTGRWHKWGLCLYWQQYLEYHVGVPATLEHKA